MTKQIRSRAFILALLFFCTLQLQASEWKWVGPIGGSIDRIVQDPANANVWFTTNQQKFYRSTNTGKTWQAVISPTDALQISTRPNGEVIVLGRSKSVPLGLWISGDHGKSFSLRARYWTYGNEDLPKVALFRPDMNDPNVFYGIDRIVSSKLEKSTDGGVTWEIIKAPAKYWYDDVVVSPFDRNVLYVSACAPSEYWGCDFFVLLRTNPNFSSWTEVPNGRGNYLKLHADSRFPVRVFFTTQKGIGSLTPSGWKILSDVGNVSEIHSVPGRSGQYVALQKDDASEPSTNRILSSNDAGRSWTSLTTPFDNMIQTIATIGQEKGLLVGTDGSGLYHLSCSNEWSAMNHGFRNASSIASIASAGSSQSYVLASDSYSEFHDGRFLYRTNNSGSSWQNLSFRFNVTGMDDYYCCIRAMVVDPLNPNRIVMAGYNELLRSTDGGLNWTRSDYAFDSLTMDPLDGNTVYATIGEYSNDIGVYKSTDGGGTFQRLPLNFPSGELVTRVIVDHWDHRILFLLFSGFDHSGMYRSDDGGITMKSIRQRTGFGNAQRGLAPLGTIGGYLMIDESSRVFKTMDRGEHWLLISQILSKRGWRWTSIFSGDDQGKSFYAIVPESEGFRGQLFESKDGGQHWTVVSYQFGPEFQGYDRCPVLAISDPRIHPILVGTCRGIYREVM